MLVVVIVAVVDVVDGYVDGGVMLVLVFAEVGSSLSSYKFVVIIKRSIFGLKIKLYVSNI